MGEQWDINVPTSINLVLHFGPMVLAQQVNGLLISLDQIVTNDTKANLVVRMMRESSRKRLSMDEIRGYIMI